MKKDSLILPFGKVLCEAKWHSTLQGLPANPFQFPGNPVPDLTLPFDIYWMRSEEEESRSWIFKSEKDTFQTFLSIHTTEFSNMNKTTLFWSAAVTASFFDGVQTDESFFAPLGDTSMFSAALRFLMRKSYVQKEVVSFLSFLRGHSDDLRKGANYAEPFLMGKFQGARAKFC